MKYFLLSIIGILLVSLTTAQDSTYYWYDDQKTYLKYEYDREFLLLSEINTEESLETLLKNQTPVDIEVLYTENLIMNKISSEPIQYKWAIVDKHQSSVLSVDTIGEILYKAPYFKTKEGRRIGISHLFYVKLKNEEHLSVLQKLANETNVEIVNHDKNMPLWYTLSCNKNSKGNSLYMSNYYYETGLFTAAEPDFLMEQSLQSPPNDEYFGDQWGLYNFGQFGGTSEVDMNIIDAWATTEGDKNITVAVIDHGIERDHPDLTSLSPYSYDTETQSSPNGLYGEHGMPIAGIICSDKDNNIGVAGIAPNSLLMAISNGLTYMGTTATQQQLADGILYAVNNGAALISCSWITPSSTYISNAIDYAISNGRGGLGCVIVCAAGNWNTNSVDWPASYRPEILAVGAMSPCGERKSPSSCDTEDTWGSCYGEELDLVAPGVLIAAVDLQGDSHGYNSSTPLHIDAGGTILLSDYVDTDYTVMFGGTSGSTPHVSGVAALVLSVNNGLTLQEVNDILESTAQNVGLYNYNTHEPGRQNGPWHEEMGYGLVDAGAAVQSAVCEHVIENTTYTSNITIDGCSSVDMENISVEDNAILTIENVGSISINGTFEAEVGTQLVFDP